MINKPTAFFAEAVLFVIIQRMCVSNINLFYQYSIAVFPTYLFYHILNLPSIIQICRIFSKTCREKYTFTQKNEQTEVHSSKILFSLFQRRFKSTHDNISRLNSVLLVKWRSVTKRIIQTKLLVLYLAHSVIRQNVKRFQRLEL